MAKFATLLPCPFCGGSVSSFVSPSDLRNASIVCPDCGCEVRNTVWESIAESEYAFKEETLEKAQKALAVIWNRRVVKAQNLREMAIEINNLQTVIEEVLKEVKVRERP